MLPQIRKVLRVKRQKNQCLSFMEDWTNPVLSVRVRLPMENEFADWFVDMFSMHIAGNAILMQARMQTVVICPALIAEGQVL